MKKNVLSGITAAAFFLSCYGTALAGTPSVVVNQQTLQLDQPPVIVQSRTLVPMRAIFEALGCEVTWDQDSQTVFAQKELNSISIEIGDTTMYTSSKNRILDVPAQIINGRTMVPLRAVSEALNADVSWNTDTETVTVTTKGQGDYKYTSGSYKKTQGIASVDTIYPQFIVPSDKNDTILTGINQELAAAATSRAIDFFHQCSDFNDSALDFNCFAQDRFAVTYNKAPYCSILSENMMDFHGAHPSTIRTSVTYDMENGKVLALTDILAGDQTAIEKLIHDGFLAQAKADPDNHYVESDAVLTQAIADKKYGYYLNDTGLTIYFQQYAIAPYAAGFQEYTIPFSQTSTFNSNFLK